MDIPGRKCREIRKCMQNGWKWEEMMKNEYLLQLIAQVEKRNPGEPEFHQAVREVFSSLEPVVQAHPIYL